MIATIQTNIVLFLNGIIDSLSFHKCLPILVNCKDARNVTLKVLVSNILLLLGSLLIYHKGIIPTIDFMSTKVPLIDDKDPLIAAATNNIVSHIIYLCYTTLWVIPIFIICYTSSSAWYQELADHVYKFNLTKKNGEQKVKGLKDSVKDGTYATVAWLMIFIQVQILNNLTPIISSYMKKVLEYVFTNITHEHTILYTIHILSHNIIEISHIIGLFTGVFLSMALYGWYGFDPYWISSGLDPDERFTIMENHWGYFCGFGFPYVLLGRNTSFFVGYGIFLALFPFCIMLGCTLDYNDPYKNKKVKALEIYKPAKIWTKTALYWIGNKSSKKEKSS